MLRKAITICTIICVYLPFSSSQNTITFVNTGAMYVAQSNAGTGVSLYIPDAMRHVSESGRSVSVVQNGITELGGSFYHDANNTVFEISLNTTGISTGIFRFTKDHNDRLRKITTYNNDISNFDRTQKYIAFPRFEIATNDSIELPGKMGIDAISLHRSSGKTGQLILRSEVLDDYSYDASLRITASGSSENLVDIGSVIVERDMTLYRPDDGSTQLFGFATPFKNTQLSGYFAGNWVRRPLANGTYGHTTYVYGNKDTSPADNVIDADQYIYYAAEKLLPAQAYLIKPRPKGFDYSLLQSQKGLWYSGEQNPSMYDKGKFIFNGKVYTATPYHEQVFADDVLFTKTINTTTTSTVNWLIGNSFTCPIPLKKVVEAMESSQLVFSPYIYVYPAGATTYQAIDVSDNDDPINTIEMAEIPAMSIFMLRLSKGNIQNGTFSITREMLQHGNVAHNQPASVTSYRQVKSTSAVGNQITCKITSEANTNIYDVAAFGFRNEAVTGVDKYDIPKATVNDDNLFQMYFQTPQNTKLSSCSYPLSKDSVMLYFTPSKSTTKYILTVVNTDKTKEGAWLYDRKLNTYTDLIQTTEYPFQSAANDASDRFLILFKKPVTTGIDDAENQLSIYCHENDIYVRQLTSDDVGNTICIYGVNGALIFNSVITSWPEFKIPAKGLIRGVYVAEMKGSRNAAAKCIKTL